MGRNVGDPSGGETKKPVFFIGNGARGGKRGGGELGKVVNCKGPPFVEVAQGFVYVV